MTTTFGPWSTAIVSGTPARLSTLWKGRMARLVQTGRSSMIYTRWNLLWLAIAFVCFVSLPTLQPAAAVGGGQVRGDGGVPPPRGAAADALPSLVARWDQQRTEITTAHIRYDQYIVPGAFAAELTPGEVNAVLNSIDFSRNREDLKPLIDVNRLPEHVSRDDFDTRSLWQTNEFFAAGGRTREQSLQGGEVVRVQLFDGEHVLRWNGRIGQFNVETVEDSVIRRVALSDFRDLPRIRLDPGLPVQERGEERVTFKLGDRGGRLVVHEPTGLVERLVAVSDRDGQVSWEIQQRGTRTDGGITFPHVKIETRYRDGKLSFLEIFVIDTLRFNHELPPETFRLAVPAGTTIVDRRGGAIRPRPYRTREALPDVAARIRSHRGDR